MSMGSPKFQMDMTVCATDLFSDETPLYLMFPYTEKRPGAFYKAHPLQDKL